MRQSGHREVRPGFKLRTIAIAVYFVAQPATASEFTRRPQANGPDVIGIIEPGDDKKCDEIASDMTKASVTLKGEPHPPAVAARRRGAGSVTPHRTSRISGWW